MTYATIGTSEITEKWIESCKESGKWELAAVYSRSAEKADKFASKHNAKPFSDLAKMSIADFDAVYIASPNHLHTTQAALFIEHGKHVICEKPMAKSENDILSIFEVAEKNNVFLFEAFRHIHMPGFSVLEQQLSRIAPLRSVSLSYNQYSSRYQAFLQGAKPNVFNPEMNGGALYDIGIYPLSLAIALWGEPSSIKSSLVRLTNGIDGAGALILDYGGFICTITFSKIAQDAVENQFLGENGAIVIDNASELLSMRHVSLKGNPEKIVVPSYSIEHRMAHEAKIFAEIISTENRKQYEKYKDISILTAKCIDKIL